MSEHRHPGPHPDADQLAALMEGALTEQQRQESLTHLAECAECRNVVFLAQQAIPMRPPEPDVPPAWRRWLPPLSLAAVAVACGLIVILWMHPHPAPRSVTSAVAVARQVGPPQPPVSAAAPVAAAPQPAAPTPRRLEMVAKKPVPASPKMQAPAAPPSSVIGGFMAGQQAQAAPPAQQQTAPPIATDQTPAALAARGAATTPLGAGSTAGSAAAQHAQGNVAAMHAGTARQLVAPAAAPTVNGALVQVPTQNALFASTGALHVIIKHNQGPDNGLSAIRGTVTDPSGATVSRASIRLQATTSGATAVTVSTDAGGRFTLAAVTPGQYELQISAPGFRTEAERLALQARDIALLSPTLQVGTSSTTVEVVSAGKALVTTPATTDAQLAAVVPVLPGKLPSLITVVRNGRILALDTSGTLYLSRNAGRRWKRIRPVWTGSIARLALAGETEPSAFEKREISGSAPLLFELTTTDGTVWISSDGAHWRLR